MNFIHPDVERLFSDELQPGESVAWSAAPAPSRMSRKSLPLVLFGLPWTAFAVFWMFAASGFKLPDFSGPGHFFPLFGLPFVLIGIGLLSSPFWMGRKARRTGYYVTNRRALLIEKQAFRGFKVRSFYPRELGKLERVQLADGSGDIILERIYRAGAKGGNQVVEVGFYGVPEVRSVERLLAQLAESAGAANPRGA